MICLVFVFTKGKTWLLLNALHKCCLMLWVCCCICILWKAHIWSSADELIWTRFVEKFSKIYYVKGSSNRLASRFSGRVIKTWTRTWGWRNSGNKHLDCLQVTGAESFLESHFSSCITMERHPLSLCLTVPDSSAAEQIVWAIWF